MQFLTMLQAGGLMMMPIVVASIVAVALILEVWWLLSRSRATLEQVQDGEGATAIQNRGDLFSSLFFWLRGNQNAPPNQRQDHADRLLAAVERRISWLSTIAAVAPLLGLLGTISGMIHNFALVAAVRPTDPLNQLSKGISEALIATAAGLVVAIIAAVGHHGLMNLLDGFSAQVEAYLHGPGNVIATDSEKRASIVGA